MTIPPPPIWAFGTSVLGTGNAARDCDGFWCWICSHFLLKPRHFSQGLQYFPCLFHFHLLGCSFQIANTNMFGILLATSVSPEITMALGILLCYFLHSCLKLQFPYLWDRNNKQYLKGLVWGVNNMIPVSRSLSTLCPAQSKPSLNVNYYYDWLFKNFNWYKPRKENYLEQLFAKCVPQTSSINTKILGLYCSPTELETLEVGPSNLCFKKPSRWFWYMLEFENHFFTGFSNAHFFIWEPSKENPFNSLKHSE